MKKWEYKHRLLHYDDDFEEEMNRLGDEGWELVAVTDSSTSSYTHVYFKREKQTKE